MEKVHEIVKIVKEKILTDAMSFVSIVNVNENINFEGDLMLYISTDNMESVEVDNLKALEKKYTDVSTTVSVLIPETKFIDGKHIENKDSVNIFIRKA